MRTIPKQKFTQEFRKEAVKLVIEQGLSKVEAARRLGMSGKTLNGWIVAAKAGKLEEIDAKRVIPVNALEAELSKLRKENAVLREEREILKKATAFFAKESR
jgi:transposase-like protein